MTENEIAKQILDTAFVVHTKLGPGLLESVYEVVLAYELKKKGLTPERQKPMPILYDNIQFDEAFRSDLVVNGKVIAELKSVEALLPVHAKQLLTQLRLSGLRLGLLINFGEAHLKMGSNASSTATWIPKILLRFRCDLCGRCVRNPK